MQSKLTPTTTKGALGLIFSIMLMDVIGITLLSPVAPYITIGASSEREFGNAHLERAGGRM